MYAFILAAEAKKQHTIANVQTELVSAAQKEAEMQKKIAEAMAEAARQAQSEAVKQSELAQTAIRQLSEALEACKGKKK